MPRERLEQLARALPSAARRRPAGTLEDLDSIERLELVLAVEEEFGVEFAEAELQTVGSLAAFDALLEAKLKARPPGEPVARAAADQGDFSRPADSLPGRMPLKGLLHLWTRLWFRIEVSGLHELPRAGACLLCANHSSHLDSVVLMAASRARRSDLIFSAARDYFFDHRWSGRIARAALPMVPFEREGGIGGLRQNLRQLEAGCAQGRVLVLFPEGTRSPDGRLQAFKPGLGFFAERLGVPVVPCWIQGTAEALPRGARWPRPRRISVRFGRALCPAGIGGGEALAELARAAMQSLRA